MLRCNIAYRHRRPDIDTADRRLRNPDRERERDTGPHRNRDAAGHGDPAAHIHAGAHHRAYADTDLGTHGNPQTDFGTHSAANGGSHPAADGNAHRNADCYAEPDADGKAEPHADGKADTDADATAKPTPVPTAKPTPTPTASPTPAATPANALGFVFAPYEYNGDFGGNVITTATTGSTESALSAMPSGLTAMTWAFATGTCGSEQWSGVSPSALVAANVQAWVNAGKKYIISTGGANASFLCPTAAGFASFVKTYYSPSMLGVDFDIENGQTQAQINALVQDCVAASVTYPNLRWSFTVPIEGATDGSDPFGGSSGDQVMAALKQFGLKNYTINIMAMDFANLGQAGPSFCVVVGKVCEMGQSAVQAAIDVNKLGVPYSKIEVTVINGGNDSTDETFTIPDVATLANFVKANGVAGVHFWEFNRDNDCSPTTSQKQSDTCNFYGKAGTLGFTKAFLSNGL